MQSVAKIGYCLLLPVATVVVAIAADGYGDAHDDVDDDVLQRLLPREPILGMMNTRRGVLAGIRDLACGLRQPLRLLQPQQQLQLNHHQHHRQQLQQQQLRGSNQRSYRWMDVVPQPQLLSLSFLAGTGRMTCFSYRTGFHLQHYCHRNSTQHS